MKKPFALTLLILIACTLHAQDLAGDWKGIIKVGAIDMRALLSVKYESAYKASVTMVDQGGAVFQSKAFSVADKSVTFEHERFSFEGTLGEDGKITGNWVQGNVTYPTTFERGKWEFLRPQEPKAPFPYREEEVNFVNPDVEGVSLSGTLALPEGDGPFPLAILLSGSGPSDRNEEILKHKPFWVISDYLARRGIAVLRYDDRGVGRSTGSFSTATTADFAADAKAALAYVRGRKDLNIGKIGYIGHSEGGMTSQIAAADAPEVGFIVMLAGPGVSGAAIIPEQTRLIIETTGGTAAEATKAKETHAVLCDIVVKSKSIQQGRDKATKYMQKLAKTDSSYTPQVIQAKAAGFNTVWMRYFLKMEPSRYLPRVHCPVLALWGERDVQVPPNQSLDPLKQGLAQGGNTAVTTMVLPGMNHLFQTCKSCNTMEYGALEETFAPAALEAMGQWLDAHAK